MYPLLHTQLLAEPLPGGDDEAGGHSTQAEELEYVLAGQWQPGCVSSAGAAAEIMPGGHASHAETNVFGSSAAVQAA